MEIVGSRGTPNQTLVALKEALKGIHFSQATAIYVTDWQDQRGKARFALYVHQARHQILSQDAFGPRFGAGGNGALLDITQWLQTHGVLLFKEAVLAPSQYSALFEDPKAHSILIANAAPVDPSVYIKQGLISRT
jgi:hypothetical protein